MRSLPPFTRKCYFDVVRVWTRRDAPLRAALEPHCRLVRVQHPPTRRPFGHELDAAVQLHRPSREAIESLVALAQQRMVLINYVEVALDLLTETTADAQALWDYLDAHLVQRWHGGDPVKYAGGTRYTRRRRWGQRQLVLYADHVAARKHAGQPACHLELRASSAGHLKRLDLQTPDKLLALDHDAFWRRHLVLEEPDVRLIGRQARGRARAKRPDMRRYHPRLPTFDADLRCGRRILRAAAQSDRGATAQDVRDALRDCPWFRATSSMRRLPLDPLVPAVAPPLIKVPKPHFPSIPGSASPSACNTTNEDEL